MVSVPGPPTSRLQSRSYWLDGGEDITEWEMNVPLSSIPIRVIGSKGRNVVVTLIRVGIIT